MSDRDCGTKFELCGDCIRVVCHEELRELGEESDRMSLSLKEQQNEDSGSEAEDNDD